MQRQVRAYFRVIRVNRWTLAFVLLVALAAFLLPTDNPRPASVESTAVVKQGVTVLNREFSGKSESQARAMLAELALFFDAPPITAREGRWTDGVTYVIPELNGQSLDIDTTWFRLAAAAEGSRIDPATTSKSPNKRLLDFPQSVIRQGNPNKQAVSLLVNVDWGTVELTQMLPVFKRRGVKVTFFVSGRWANENKELIQRMKIEGHEIATHGHDLKSGPKELVRSGQLKADIMKSIHTIEEAAGTKVKYYAPHMSEVDPEILKTAADLQLRTVLYSLDTVDWRDSTTTAMILTTISRAMPGDLILLHPKPNTTLILDTLLHHLQSRGLRPVTLTEMLSPEPGTPPAALTGQHE